MIYTVITIISLIMASAIYCACLKPGKAENICKYDQGDMNK